METRVPGGRIGIAPHSLRAVTLDDLRWVADTWRGQPAHIHVSEQTREVEDCLAAHGRRPVDLLMDTVAVDEHWCLVHATHADAGERARIAERRAVVGLCPITEANLGDGLFDVPDFLAHGGRCGVVLRLPTSASTAADELRTLEYGQTPDPSPAQCAWADCEAVDRPSGLFSEAALAGGRQGRRHGRGRCGCGARHGRPISRRRDRRIPGCSPPTSGRHVRPSQRHPCWARTATIATGTVSPGAHRKTLAAPARL
jgi:hypothetical protein